MGSSSVSQFSKLPARMLKRILSSSPYLQSQHWFHSCGMSSGWLLLSGSSLLERPNQGMTSHSLLRWCGKSQQGQSLLIIFLDFSGLIRSLLALSSLWLLLPLLHGTTIVTLTIKVVMEQSLKAFGGYSDTIGLRLLWVHVLLQSVRWFDWFSSITGRRWAQWRRLFPGWKSSYALLVTACGVSKTA